MILRKKFLSNCPSCNSEDFDVIYAGKYWSEGKCYKHDTPITFGEGNHKKELRHKKRMREKYNQSLAVA